MKIHHWLLIIIAIIMITIAISLIIYPHLPETIASHWNSRGVADGYSSRFWGVFLIPIMVTGLSILYLLIPRIDPLKANIKKFQNYYYGFIVLFLVYMLYIQILIIYWNLGNTFDMTLALVPASSALFFAIGFVVGKAKRNYFIGIRTPWTLNNEEVWNKTHKLGGVLFKIAAVVVLFGLVFREYAIWFIMAPVLLTAVIAVIYSYVVYQKIAST